MIDKTLILFNIQRYSLHDGEGIRTVFFLKGCPLHCLWCCNPESQDPRPEIMYQKNLCLGSKACGRCLKNKVIAESSYIDAEDKCVHDIKKCGHFLSCADLCPSNALKVVGKEWKLSELIKEAQKDAIFYGEEGGITLSGGEPLAQDSAIDFLKLAKEEYFNTAIETCGQVSSDRIIECSKYLDKIFFDIKTLDAKKHQEFTGASGVKIQNNFKLLCDIFPNEKITVRTPVIPEFNDKQEELDLIEDFLKDYPKVNWEKLPYHKFGVNKYEMLGREYSISVKQP